MAAINQLRHRRRAPLAWLERLAHLEHPELPEPLERLRPRKKAPLELPVHLAQPEPLEPLRRHQKNSRCAGNGPGVALFSRKRSSPVIHCWFTRAGDTCCLRLTEVANAA